MYSNLRFLKCYALPKILSQFGNLVLIKTNSKFEISRCNFVWFALSASSIGGVITILRILIMNVNKLNICLHSLEDFVYTES